jgi:hypothetical protein
MDEPLLGGILASIVVLVHRYLTLSELDVLGLCGVGLCGCTMYALCRNIENNAV